MYYFQYYFYETKKYRVWDKRFEAMPLKNFITMVISLRFIYDILYRTLFIFFEQKQGILRILNLFVIRIYKNMHF